MFMRIVLMLGLLVALAGCATAPAQPSNVCAVFSEKGGWFNNWHRHAKRTEREFGVPVPILMATIYTESTFQPRARPPRTRLFGVIPWKRKSSAYGYSQALDGTWNDYRQATGRRTARRTNFADAVHFVGWYHHQSHRRNGIARNDAYNLYLAYYAGHGGYARGVWRSRPEMQRAARRTAERANTFAAQMRQCGLS
jgi:hypothetical protein